MKFDKDNMIVRPDLRIIEGTCDEEPTQMELLKYLIDNINFRFLPTNIDISYDDFQGFWRWDVEYINSPSDK